MLQKDNLQREYSGSDIRRIRDQSNLNLVNLADVATRFIQGVPNEIKRLSIITDKLSNLMVIAGNTYHYNTDFKVIESKDVEFDGDTLKLKPTLSYRLEPTSSKFITDKKVRVFNKDKNKLMSLDDLLVRKQSINIVTEENSYKYTLGVMFNELTQLNNIKLKLNEETESYPHITEVYYINNRQEKKNVKILNNNLYDIDLDLIKNSENIYTIDIETVSSDNIYIVLEDHLNELILDELDVNYMEYPDEGYIILEAISNEKPILKVGLELDGQTKAELSHNLTDWVGIDISNTYALEKHDKVVAYNTINSKSIKTEEDVKKVYLKLTLSSLTEVFTPLAKINKSSFVSGTFDSGLLRYDSYSLYENSASNYYGKLSTHNRFDFRDLYDNGEYLIVDNKYFVKGFIDSEISKSPKSQYTYSPVSLKTKEVKVSGDLIDYPNIDISTKEVYSTTIEKITRNLIDSSSLKLVLPLKEQWRNTKYYISQGNDVIPVDLSLGYINSAIDVLYVVRDEPVYLLDYFKTKVKELPRFTLDDIVCVSLIEMFEGSVSKTYPITPLQDDELGFLDNAMESFNKDRELTLYSLSTKKLYTKDNISHKNTNYAEILSYDDYKQSFTVHSEEIPKYKNTCKLMKSGVVKGSVTLEGLLEIPFINGYSEFLEYFSREFLLNISEDTLSYKIELDEDKVLPKTLTHSFPELSRDSIKVSIEKEGSKYFLKVENTESLKDTKLLVSYTYENTQPKELYSINYTEGVIHFSEPVDKELRIDYKSDNLISTGKAAKQLSEEDYTEVNKVFNIRNPKDNTSIFFLYKDTREEHRNITPILNNIKVNYILKDATSL